MDAVAIPKRRRNVRYITGGKVIFHTGSADSYGDLVNLGQYGVLVRTNVRVPAGTQFRIGFTVDGYATPFQCESQVAGIHSGLLAMKFLGAMAELAPLLQWLDRENVPWTGLETPDSVHAIPALVTAPAGLPSSKIENRDAELEAILPFLEAMG